MLQAAANPPSLQSREQRWVVVEWPFPAAAGLTAGKSGCTEREKTLSLLLLWNCMTVWCNAFFISHTTTNQPADKKCISTTKSRGCRFISIHDAYERHKQKVNQRLKDAKLAKKYLANWFGAWKKKALNSKIIQLFKEDIVKSFQQIEGKRWSVRLELIRSDFKLHDEWNRFKQLLSS